TVTVASLSSERRVPRSFLGLSTEYWTPPVYADHLRTLERALSLLRPRGAGPLLLRIGGASADHAVWDPRRRPLPARSDVATPRSRDLRGLVKALRLRLIADLNLLTSSPGAASRWARIALRALPRHSVAAFEIGNEPDIYDRLWWRTVVARSGGSVRLL